MLNVRLWSWDESDADLESEDELSSFATNLALRNVFCLLFHVGNNGVKERGFLSDECCSYSAILVRLRAAVCQAYNTRGRFWLWNGWFCSEAQYHGFHLLPQLGDGAFRGDSLPSSSFSKCSNGAMKAWVKSSFLQTLSFASKRLK